ncbi:hypothetical protein [Terrabacter sp. NPDC000476]|uniref:hypothetical protein n=1 Tax=Terrabacter sp. NPDC000476 TaxID=3154258 RepID=UPI0033252FBA
MTSSADTRRTTVAAPAAGAAAPRRRVAGSRRRPSAHDAAQATAAGRAVAAPERRDTEGTGPVGTTEATGTASAAGAASAAVRRRRRGLLAPAAAVLLALALLATSLVVALRPAVSEADRTAAVGSARTTLESLLSYSGASFDAHVREVTPQLTAPFRDQFTKVAASDIKPMAVKNRATVQAKVYDAGVLDATGGGGEGTTVRVMAFVNQATTTTAQPAPAIDQNRVIATMRKVGERWLVSDLTAY